MKRIIFDKYPKRLTVVRHGQSVLNAMNISTMVQPETIQPELENISDENAPLTPLGLQQALQCGEYITKYGPFDMVCHSGYTRTLQTMDQLLVGIHKSQKKVPEIIENISLREREIGHTFGVTVSEVKKRFPYLSSYYERTSPYLFRPPGGESIADVYERVKSALRDIFAEYSSKNILLVSHGRVISTIRFALEDSWTLQKRNALVEKGGPRNCGIMSYDLDRKLKKMVLCSYDEICY